MPYVEGFGAWPFGEEWLWEAMAGSYLPLLELLERDAPLTLSLSPVLCDQLQAPSIAERFGRFVSEVRSYTHMEDAQGLRAGGHEGLALAVERSWRDYEHALELLADRGGDLLGALGPYAQWTSSATHSVLPLLASDRGVALQVRTGVQAHRRRFGEHWRGGFWLPECAHATWLEGTLTREGVRSTCVELTDRFGLGASEHLRPLLCESGLVLVPIDRETISLVWSEGGYPADGEYRDYHHHTIHHHNPWSNAGGVYDGERARLLAREHARDFVSRTLERLRLARSSPGGGASGDALLVCALDTELLGHWWYEGIEWLSGVVEEGVRQGLELVRLDDALERIEPIPLEPRADRCSPSSWGKGGDLSTWSGPAAASMAFAARRCELDVLAAAPVGDGAARALLALQASDWPFMVSNEIASGYAEERFEGHLADLGRMLGGACSPGCAKLRNLAPGARGAVLEER